MRTFLIAGMTAAALVAAAPAAAQRASLADRVTALELRAARPDVNVDLLNRITQLESELRALRSQVEELQQLNEQMRSTARSQYLDLDGRLNRLEGGSGAPAAPVPPAPKPAAAGAGARPATGAGAAPPAALADRRPAVYGDAGTLAQGADERAAYDAAFAHLRAGDYVESARAFKAFLERHPGGVYAPNAMYWLGESYYVTQNYPLALAQFQGLLDRYPTHDKAAGALLKVGLSQLGLRQLDAAERTLRSVVDRYPDSDSARTARDRLNSIELARLR